MRLLGGSAGIAWQQTGGGHADERETSLMLAIAPHLVRLERAVNAETSPAQSRRPLLSPWPDPQAQHSPTGATGNPTVASAEKGHLMLAAMVEDIVRLTAPLKADP